jgi:hypothetical protein
MKSLSAKLPRAGCVRVLNFIWDINYSEAKGAQSENESHANKLDLISYCIKDRLLGWLLKRSLNSQPGRFNSRTNYLRLTTLGS